MQFKIDGTRFRLRFEHDVPRKDQVLRTAEKGRLVKGATRALVERQMKGMKHRHREERSPGRWIEIALGSAWCSYEDQFSKERGRRVALTRAIEGWPRDKRAKIWECYFERRPRRLVRVYVPLERRELR